MEFLLLGFFTSLSLILAIGAQNIFVIEQGLKKQYVFIVCLICSISDLLLIFLGIFLFEYFKFFFNNTIDADYKKGKHKGEDLYEMDGFSIHFFSNEKIKSLLNGFLNLSIENFNEGSYTRKLSLVINQKNKNDAIDAPIPK